MKVDLDVNNVTFIINSSWTVRFIIKKIILENDKTVFCTLTIQDEKFMPQLT